MFESKRAYFYTSRSEFERNFSFLEELINNRRLNMGEGRSIKSLMRIRRLPNGRLDLNTVDELARSTAMMAGNFENMHGENNENK